MAMTYWTVTHEVHEDDPEIRPLAPALTTMSHTNVWNPIYREEAEAHRGSTALEADQNMTQAQPGTHCVQMCRGLAETSRPLSGKEMGQGQSLWDTALLTHML